MVVPWSGIERRLERLDDCANKLEALSGRPRSDFAVDPVLRDVAERNFEVAAQCVIDIAMRIISLEGAPRTTDGAEAIRRLAELGVLPPDFARDLAPISGFRNILVHEYLDIDWEIVHRQFSNLGQLRFFAARVRDWLTADRGTPPDRGA
jgi:uncharacterized protein YutE (UPF0331/DUF86 family)